MSQFGALMVLYCLTRQLRGWGTVDEMSKETAGRGTRYQTDEWVDPLYIHTWHTSIPGKYIPGIYTWHIYSSSFSVSLFCGRSAFISSENWDWVLVFGADTTGCHGVMDDEGLRWRLHVENILRRQIDVETKKKQKKLRKPRGKSKIQGDGFAITKNS